MKKTISAAVVAAMLTTTAAPAFAGDEAMRLGIGLGLGILGQMMKGGGKSHGNRKGGTYIGRVGDREAQAQPRKRTGGKATAAVAGATAGAAAVAFALPEGDKAPTPQPKPTPEEMTAYLAAAQNAPPSTFQNGEPEVDEIHVAATTVEATAAPADDFPIVSGAAMAEGAGVKAATPEPQQQAQAAPAEQPAKKGPMPEGYDYDNPPYGTQWRSYGPVVVDERGSMWDGITPEQIAQIDKATDGGMIRSEAIVKFSDYAQPGVTKERMAAEQAAVEKANAEREAKRKALLAEYERQQKEAEAKRAKLFAEQQAKQEADRKAQEAEAQREQAEAERLAEIERKKAAEAALFGEQTAPVAVDTEATTASTEKAPAVSAPATDLAQPEAAKDGQQAGAPAKPKVALDL